jgi:hypothetical protein
MGKLTRPQIWIIFGVLSLIAVLTLWFTLNDPRIKDIATEQSRYEARNQVAETKAQADKKYKDAKIQVAAAKSDWSKYERRFMPTINISNLYTAWQQIQKEQLYVLGPKLDKFVRADKGVQIVQAGFSLYPPPDDPNQANAPLLTENKGAVTVSGNFDAILKHVERWNNFDRLVLVTGFSLQGNSPRLFGSYNLQVFEFTQGETPGPSFPAASSGTGGGGMGGMMGGGMGMMSGSMGPGMSGSMGPGMSGSMGPGMSGRGPGGGMAN